MEGRRCVAVVGSINVDLAAFGSPLPRRGETVVIGGIEFRVMRADRRRVESLRVATPKDVIAPEERAARDRD